MGEPQILTGGARLAGSAAATAIALIGAAWIILDLYEADHPARLWRSWAGLAHGAQNPLYSDLTDLVLFLTCAAVAVTVIRSPSATSSLVAAGLLAVAVRTPSIWLLTDEPRFGAFALRERALASAAVTVGLGLVLLMLAAFGRRPPGERTAHPAAFGEDAEPLRPLLGAAVTTLLVLGSAAVAGIAWEIDRARRLGWDLYQHHLTGTGSGSVVAGPATAPGAAAGPSTLLTPLSPPPSWLPWCTALLALAAVVAAMQRASFARALGMTAATVYVVYGAMGVHWVMEGHALRMFAELSVRSQLGILTPFWYVLAGLGTLIVLCFGYERRYGAWAPAGGGAYGPPPPPSPAPPGW
ncbi:hypothetical protein [Streptomyces sp. KLOTTS4A1]|uniref:hypothetical protein n=1 Tax=Streptomyces sp. KLOTTS4A1 TaxID=3390996 RepID=UPI0039F4F467